MKLTESLNLRDFEIILLFYLQLNILFTTQHLGRETKDKVEIKAEYGEDKQ